MNKILLKITAGVISMLLLFTVSCKHEQEPHEQIMIPAVEKMPNIPQPFKMRDWEILAQDFDELVYDFEADGEFYPLIWIDDTKRNLDVDSYGIYTFLGDNRQGGEIYEGIVALGSTLSGTLVGIDKSNQNGYNFAQMSASFMNTGNNRNVISNGTNTGDGSFWYSIFPSIPFMGLLHYYPQVQELAEFGKINSDKWYEAVEIMGGDSADFYHTYFDFTKMEPVDNGLWYEPDAAAGIAWIQYLSYSKWGEPKYLEAAKWCMDYLENLDPADNPFYEVLMPYGVYIAARMNAEMGYDYDVYKMLSWLFDGMSIRPAWGVINEKWGEMDAHGLQGSMTDNGGYAFAMNTFSMAMPLVPMVRYDSRFAKTIGKWMLNAANNARLFYPEELPDDMQSCPEYIDMTNNVIAYEGLVKKWGLKSPYAMGDARKYGWARTDFGLYGSSYVGIFGGIISQTNDEKILQLDCLKTDFIRDEAYPTYLYYNPYDASKTIEIKLEEGSKNLYDVVLAKFVAKNVSGISEITIPADSASLIVITPADGKVIRKEGKLFVDDIIIDYNLR